MHFRLYKHTFLAASSPYFFQWCLGKEKPYLVSLLCFCLLGCSELSSEKTSKHNSQGGFKKCFSSSAPLFPPYSDLAIVFLVSCSIYCLLRGSYLRGLISKKYKHLEPMLISNISLESRAPKVCVLSPKPLSYSLWQGELKFVRKHPHTKSCSSLALFVFLSVNPGKPITNAKKPY